MENRIYENDYESNVDLEIELLLEAIKRKYGYDFKEYSRNHIRRRVFNKIEKDRLKNISEMQNKVIYSREYFTEVKREFSINVTEMFRDYEFFNYFRDEIVPYLESYNKLKIWNAGCSTGEEAYSTGIILREMGLLNRSIIYATDFNDYFIEKAQRGEYSKKLLDNYRENYMNSGGREDFENYIIKCGEVFNIKDEIKEKILFTKHNLACDKEFGKMNIIFCRNVMIYFNKELQERVLQLFSNSLVRGGMLCLGINECIHNTEILKNFEVYSEKYRIYKKKF